jgi:hypothetical protein
MSQFVICFRSFAFDCRLHGVKIPEKLGYFWFASYVGVRLISSNKAVTAST